jgi:hypothetical protein
MLTAGIIIETVVGKAVEVEHQLAVVPEVRILGREATHLTAVCTVPDGQTLSAILDRIAAEHDGIVAIQTTFVRE